MSRVLVVDDEKSIRVTLCAFLWKEGFEADAVADVLSAYQMMEVIDYDIIITDIIMPHVSGIELMQEIRRKSPSIQIIIMTGEPTVDTAVKAVQNGANNYLIKPIKKEDFLKAINQAAQIKALTDQQAVLESQNQKYQRSLEKIVEIRTEELQKAMQSIISLLSSVVEMRDPYTAGHQRRVGNLSAAIAAKMGLDAKTTNYLRMIGYIHDIGKIVIPTEILSKPGHLSQPEFQIIRNHPTAGYEMINKVHLPQLIGETIYQHHERCDGSGYPRGLSSREISREAKIIMVADVVEATMSHRPYRPALGIEAALKEIKDYSGSYFSPDVVDACVELFEKDDYQIEDEEYITFFPL